MWVKIKPTGDRRFWSMFPLARATHFAVTRFLTHSHLGPRKEELSLGRQAVVSSESSSFSSGSLPGLGLSTCRAARQNELRANWARRFWRYPLALKGNPKRKPTVLGFEIKNTQVKYSHPERMGRNKSKRFVDHSKWSSHKAFKVQEVRE